MTKRKTPPKIRETKAVLQARAADLNRQLHDLHSERWRTSEQMDRLVATNERLAASLGTAEAKAAVAMGERDEAQRERREWAQKWEELILKTGRGDL